MKSSTAVAPATTSGDRRKRDKEGPGLTGRMTIPAYNHRDLLITLFRERRMILWVFGLTLAIGAAIALRMEPIFTAQARLIVLPSQEYTLNPVPGAAVMNFALGDERIVHSETEILKNSTLVEQVIEHLGIAQLYPDLEGSSPFAWLFSHITRHPTPDANPAPATSALSRISQETTSSRRQLYKAVTRFNKNLEILPVKDASVISLSFSHPKSALAISALETLIQKYLEFRTQTLVLSRSQMFIEQRDAFTRRLANVEQDVEAFKLKNNISIFADQRSFLLRQQVEATNNLMDTKTRLSEVEGRRATLLGQLATLPRQLPMFDERMAQDAADTARSILVTLEARRNELLTKFTPNSQFVADLNEQIEKLRRTVATILPKKSDSQRVGPSPIYQEVNSDLVRQESAAAALRAKQTSLEEQLTQLTARLVEFDKLEATFNSLALERGLVENNLRIYSQKVEESLLQEEMDRQKIANVRIIEQPQAYEPRSQKRAVLVFALLVAVIFSLLTAFFKDFFRDVFVSPEDTERALELPVLVAIPFQEGLGRPTVA
ncbi:Wzz/FepE/Etk N-terminal domain-containing protein [uncultured Thiodictyon sp.]|uniref:GumC family protein n=1 Tax=uncultured Thiodictyon sp. TaxID=1846217 RepID=UPI0025D65B1E|nr:Wzz/FepE/Etk N-terminal domain-containing protein [uncultured Thiodictyon sp.]